MSHAIRQMVLIEKHNRSRRHFVWTLLMLCFSLALLTNRVATTAKAPAQSQSLLHERLDFLKAKLESHLSHSVEQGLHAGDIKFEAISFETCNITWKISTEFGDSTDVPMPLRGVKMVNQVNVNLSSIDAARTKIYVVEQMKQRNIAWSLVLELKIRSGSRGFIQQLVTTKGGQVTRPPTLEERHYAFFFNFRDERIAEDVSKAFTDASTICRSRTQRLR